MSPSFQVLPPFIVLFNLSSAHRRFLYTLARIIELELLERQEPEAGGV